MAVTSRYLTQGAMFALEQSGLLLHDALSLYHMKSFATALVVSAHAREELRHHRILLGLRDRVLNGEAITVEQIRDDFDEHVEQQQAEMESSAERAEQRSEVGELLRAKMKHPTASHEYQDAEVALAQLDKVEQNDTASDRSALRPPPLYLQPISETEWRRPTAHVSKEAVRKALADAINDYSGAYDRFGMLAASVLKQDNPVLYQEILEWTGRPAIPYVPPRSVL